MSAEQVLALIGLLGIALAVVGIILMVIADAKDEAALDRFYRDKLYLPRSAGGPSAPGARFCLPSAA